MTSDPASEGPVRDRRTGARLNRLGLAVAVTVATGAVLAITLSFFLVWLLLGVGPGGPLPTETSVTVLDVIKVALAVVAGLGGAVALVVSYRRQAHLEHDAAGAREKEKGFRDRYGAAAQQLGDPEPSVRLAGVYAMAYLADEWEAQRQQCVDVLCTYLRLPRTSRLDEQMDEGVVEPALTDPDERLEINESSRTTIRPGEREVRRTLIRVIAAHLQVESLVSWSHLEFDFRGAHLPDADFSRALFSGKSTNFSGSVFSGSYTEFRGATFSSEETNFSKSCFFGKMTNFNGSSFAVGDTNFNSANFAGREVYFDGARFTCESADFARASFSGDRLRFSHVTFDGYTRFSMATFSCRAVNFIGTTFPGGLDLEGATFAGGRPSEFIQSIRGPHGASAALQPEPPS